VILYWESSGGLSFLLQDDSMESTDMQIDRTALKKGVSQLKVRSEADDCTRWYDSHTDRERDSDVRERQQKNTSCTCGHVLTSEGR
jgi:hypothetical protein